MISNAGVLLAVTFGLIVLWNVTLGALIYFHVRGESKRSAALIEKTLIGARGTPQEIAAAMNAREQNAEYIAQSNKVFKKDLEKYAKSKEKNIVVDSVTGHKIEIDEVLS